MSLDPKLTIILDREREVRWTMRSEAKLGRLADAPPLQDIAHRNPRRGFYSLLCYLWAAIEDTEGDFIQPDDMAELLKDAKLQATAFSTLIKALRVAGVLKPEKKTSKTKPHRPGA